ncbi:MAG TPA: hypothetical protein VGQ59_20245 [Cyclobacteriaceae bacterium]|nr:hypothetical protein [Cyclobacteriaceae bacterium]
MKQIKLGFFVGLLGILLPFLSHGQSNSLGDRAQVVVETPHHTVHKQHITHKQKLLFKKPNVKHTPDYEYYHHMEQEAREKQRVKLEEIKSRGVSHPKKNAEYKYYVRAEIVAKEKQHMLRKMDKPQYSDITYFGHKHKPKKHLPYAMRYCKECGIRH